MKKNKKMKAGNNDAFINRKNKNRKGKKYIKNCVKSARKKK